MTTQDGEYYGLSISLNDHLSDEKFDLADIRMIKIVTGQGDDNVTISATEHLNNEDLVGPLQKCWGPSCITTLKVHNPIVF